MHVDIQIKIFDNIIALCHRELPKQYDGIFPFAEEPAVKPLNTLGPFSKLIINSHKDEEGRLLLPSPTTVVGAPVVEASATVRAKPAPAPAEVRYLPKTGRAYLPSTPVVGAPVFEKPLYYSVVEASATVRAVPTDGRYRMNKDEMMEADRRAKLKRDEAWAVAKQCGGYTREEFGLVGYYLPKREFESWPEPLPWPYRQYKKFLDKIRDTRGYGLTVPTPGPVPGEDANSRPPIICIFNNRPDAFEERMEVLVMGEILKNTGKHYVVKSMANLVMCKFIYLVSYHVAAAPPEEEEEAEAAARTGCLSDLCSQEKLRWLIKLIS